ncbi:MAG: FadR/GntR family transcriptional regulator [Solirubrobacteraceae bacterium]
MTGSTSLNPTASTKIHSHLRALILDGTVAPGAPLPSERSLSDELGVGRHVVREAIKRLQQAGLVEVAQGGATRVRDWRTSGGLDVLADLARALRSEDWENLRLLLRSATEMRASLGCDAARLAAERATEAQRASIRYLAARVIEPGQGELERIEHYEELWAVILDASENIAYRLAYNSLVTARAQGGLVPAVYHREFEEPSAILELADAIAAADPERAYALAHELLNRTVHEVS